MSRVDGQNAPGRLERPGYFYPAIFACTAVHALLGYEAAHADIMFGAFLYFEVGAGFYSAQFLYLWSFVAHNPDLPEGRPSRVIAMRPLRKRLPTEPDSVQCIAIVDGPEGEKSAYIVNTQEPKMLQLLRSERELASLPPIAEPGFIPALWGLAFLLGIVFSSLTVSGLRGFALVGIVIPPIASSLFARALRKPRVVRILGVRAVA